MFSCQNLAINNVTNLPFTPFTYNLCVNRLSYAAGSLVGLLGEGKGGGGGKGVRKTERGE